MARNSKIEWCQDTWNPITGCSLVSEGCRHCYAARLAATRLRHHPSRAGLARLNAAGEAKFTGEVRFNEQWLDQPLRWRRPRRIFVCAHGDLFHESVPDGWIDRVFAVMALAPQHTFQVLTKRPERMRKYLAGPVPGEDPLAIGRGNVICNGIRGRAPEFRFPLPWPLPNVWIGTSVEDQATAEERIPHLLTTPAAVRFVSAEPLLGPVDLGHLEVPLQRLYELRGWLTRASADSVGQLEAYSGILRKFRQRPCRFINNLGVDDIGRRLDWVIVGGESGPGARPMHPDWARSIRDECRAWGTPFFMKQMAKKAPIPADLMVREQPDAPAA